MSLVVVGISGRICSGKSTLADALCQPASSHHFWRMSFANALKDDVASSCHVARHYLDEHKQLFVPVLQSHGALMRTLHGEDYWVVRLIRQLGTYGRHSVVVDDVRYPNEVAGLRTAAPPRRSLLVRLQIDPEVQAARYLAKYGRPITVDERDHISETALDDHLSDFDLVLDATQPTGEQVRVVLEELRSRRLVAA